MSNGEGRVVCVTGASGYIASWLVKLLLSRGYTVRATVRNPDDWKKVDHLLKLDGAKERLHLFKADLGTEGSFDAAIEGCDGVFHTASPVLFHNIQDPQAELIDPAMGGTINVLKSCVGAGSIRRVIITSSLAAVSFNGRPLNPDVTVDETWWSDPAFCEKSKIWYHLSKTLAEEAAWKFAKENGIDLVTINPGYVIGPILQPTINYTMKTILDLVSGGPTYRNQAYRWVDVRDVANAHILAFEVPSASGRYLLAVKGAHFSEVIEIIRHFFPTLKFPERCSDNGDPTMYNVSNTRSISLGLKYTPFELTVKDTVEDLKEKNYISF
ncbi:hypothetical protein Droror1_Dr00024461 [Drosera rotundifolia]